MADYQPDDWISQDLEPATAELWMAQLPEGEIPVVYTCSK